MPHSASAKYFGNIESIVDVFAMANPDDDND